MSARETLLAALASYAEEIPSLGGKKGRNARLSKLTSERAAIYEHAYPLPEGPRRELGLSLVFALDRLIDREHNAALNELVDRGCVHHRSI